VKAVERGVNGAFTKGFIIVMSGILIIPLDNSFVFKIIGECSDVQKLIYEKLGLKNRQLRAGVNCSGGKIESWNWIC
jgi:hypothetical protein